MTVFDVAFTVRPIAHDALLSLTMQQKVMMPTGPSLPRDSGAETWA
ncbi:hypothetical protein [Methylobacterium soli]|nr:hypothetical protein [Methylobacterium soli]GJE44655.1 hypothetical protein AEGHOMDF_3844 [Methylobacterium soli]